MKKAVSSKTLVIAEKPSVAQDIVRALTPVAGKFEKMEEHFENEKYVVTSAVGHLVEIQAPEEFDVKRGKWSFAHLPVIPPHFELKPLDKTKTRLNAIVRLAKRKDVGAFINACDAGREGELIFRLIQQYSKVKHPVQRLWLQSMTPQAIRDGLRLLRSDKQMLPLADAARCRSEADWLVGINGTRAMTAFNSRDGGFFLTTVGRVQTPTLSVVVEREEKIRKFVSRNYWEIHASFAAAAPASTPASGSTRSGRRPRPTRRPATGTSRRGTESRPCLDAGRSQGHRRRGARQDRHRHRGKQTHDAGQPAAVRPDLAAARGQRQVRLQRQDHAVHRAKPVRTPQGADLPADRLARPAGRLCAGREADLRDAGRQWHETPGTACGHRAQGQLHQAQQAHLRQRQGK
jgi:hypothetical protein